MDPCNGHPRTCNYESKIFSGASANSLPSHLTSTSMPAFTISPKLEHLNVPLQTLLTQPPYIHKRLVVGIAILSNHKLLLLQRSAHEDAYPNLYELPGGHVELNQDETIFHTIVREAMEETGLAVTAITGEFEGFEYATSKGQALQLNFFVDVDGREERGMLAPVLNPEEHQAFAWIGGTDEMERYTMSESMAVVVSNALDIIVKGLKEA